MDELQNRYLREKPWHQDNFRMLGTITDSSGSLGPLPIFGKPNHVYRGRNLYYTRNDTFNPVPLAIHVNGKNCMSPQGCDDIQTADNIAVPQLGKDTPWSVNLYDQ